MNTRVEHIAGHTCHSRTHAVKNAFRYSIDYVLLDAETAPEGPRLFKRNGRALASLHDDDHGGAPGIGRGAAWVREHFTARGLPQPIQIKLLAQPRFWGHVFNPVSFWLCFDAADALTAVIAEVTNTYGDRHSYLCRHADGRVIEPQDVLSAEKLLYVSPFQPLDGGYRFRFNIAPDRIGIVIHYDSADQSGLVATLTGPRAPATNASLIRAALRRPLGSRRVLALIHWQALILWWKGVRFRTKPTPPSEELS